MEYGFGAHDGGIFQFAWVVENLEETIDQWVRETGVGPWYVLENFTGIDGQYRGKPANAVYRLAMSFANGVNIELIQPLDDNPSVYREMLERKGHGFHHMGVLVPNVDAAIPGYEARGFAVAFKAGVPTGGNVAYLDPPPGGPGIPADFIELIPGGEMTDRAFTGMWQSTRDWDGKDPIRPFPTG